VSAVATERLLSVRSLHRRPVRLRGATAMGGDLADLLFDDQAWRVRYLVIDDHGPMPRRDVLVAPAQVRSLAPHIELALSREELKQCPELSEDPPVYLQHDMGGLPRPADPHLRSAEILIGFAVRARGQNVGRLRDLELDAERWTIDALVIDSGIWLPAKRRRVEPAEVRAMDWIARTIELG
jgi:hypothetical protein